MNTPLTYAEILSMVPFLQKMIDESLMKNEATLHDEQIILYYELASQYLGKAKDLLAEKIEQHG